MSPPPALERRVQELARASRRAALLSLGGLLMVLGALVYSVVQLDTLEDKRRNLQSRVAELTSTVHSLALARTTLSREIDQRKKVIDSLEALKDVLETWKDKLARATDTLAATVRSTATTSASQAALQRAENARYAIGLYAFGVSSDQYESVRQRLQDAGFLISQGMLLSQRPPWLSSQSSVLYYHSGALTKARSLADMLSRTTGTKFQIARGAGLAVVPGQERWTFFIHYLGK